jgi:putative membrane protein
MVPDHDRSTWARRWRHPGSTGRVKINRAGQGEFIMMGWYGNGMGTGMLLGMGVFWLVLLGLIIWLVLQLLPRSGGGSVPATGESAVEILDRRMASGELDTETWRAQRSALLSAQRDGK